MSEIAQLMFAQLGRRTTNVETLEAFKKIRANDIETSIQALERSKQYTTLVITLGYAGLFGIWSFCHKVVPESVNAVTGILASVSLSLFIAFEIAKMYSMQKVAIRNWNASKSFSFNTEVESIEVIAQRYLEAQESAKEDNKKTNAKMLKIWPFIFWPTVITGFGAMWLLMYNCAAHLTKIFPYFPT